MRTLVAACLFLAASVNAEETILDVGAFDYRCREGKLTAVTVSMNIAGDIVIPIPPDVCSAAHRARISQGVSPVAKVRPKKPLEPPPQATCKPAS